MKRNKIAAVILSIVMSMSMLMPSIEVMADETSAPSETQKTETTETKEPKATEKLIPKTTEKPVSKETKKQESEETEKAEPKETEKQEPKETEKTEPKETEKQEPKETEKTEPKETEKQEPKETEKTEPKETEKQEPKETKKTEPKETEKQDPKETEKAESKETDEPSADTPNEDDGSEVVTENPPSESVAKEAKDAVVQIGTIDNVKISKGKITWDPYRSAGYYDLTVSGCYADKSDGKDGLSFSLNDCIDWLIRNGDIEKKSSYDLELKAYGSDSDTVLAKWNGTYTYSSNATPIAVGTISNVKFDNGTMTWDAFAGADSYEARVSGYVLSWNNTRSIKINDEIDYLIREGEIEKSSSYSIKIEAYDKDNYTIARWSGTYTYDSNATFGQPGSIKNVKISGGIISWDYYEGHYTIYGLIVSGYWAVGEDGTSSFELNKTIDRLIKDGKIEKNSSYLIELQAIDSNEKVGAQWSGTYTYASSATPIQVGTISNVLFDNGTMTWDAYAGAQGYHVTISNILFWQGYLSTRYNSIDDDIDYLIRTGQIEKSNSYPITIEALDESHSTIAKWTGTYTYDSNATLGQIIPIEKVKISNGTISWNPVKGYFDYVLIISGYKAVKGILDDFLSGYYFNLNNTIDELIKNGEIEKNSSYLIELQAIDSDEKVGAQWSDTYSYNSNATPIQIGSISNVKFANGIMTWDAFAGAYDYDVTVSDSFGEETTKTTIKLKTMIDQMVCLGEIEKSSTYPIKIEAKDNDGYTVARWSGTFNYDLVNISTATVTGITDKTYSGEYITQTVAVMIGENSLEKNIDYAVSYTDNINVGTATLTITGIGNYTGVINKTFKIDPLNISEATIAGIRDKKYTGEAVTQSIIVLCGGKNLVENTDYSVSYADNINVGTATVSVIGMGNYTGTVDKSFNISLEGNQSEIVAAGICGTGLAWELDKNGTLTITGEGAMSFSGNSPWYEYKDDIQMVIIDGNVTSICDSAFSYSGIKSITMPDSVISIGNLAFYYSSLESIKMSKNVTSIGEGAFAVCQKLKNVTIPDGVTKLNNSVFGGCSSLTDITIPDSVTSIEDSAFYGCSSLTSVIIPKGVTTIGKEAFSNCTGLTNVTISGTLTTTNTNSSVFTDAFSGCTNLDVTIYDGETQIGDNAFRNCTGITNVTIPDSVTSIGKFAFFYCSSLKSITTSKSLTSIGEAAFVGCKDLKNITIPDSVTILEPYAFSGCESLTNITIPDGVTSIEEYTFSGCKGLTSIIIPKGVTSIGEKAFSDCTALTSVTISGKLTSNSENKSIFASVFDGCSNLNVIIHDGETQIGDNAFRNCTGITNVTIPDSVTSIGKFAFFYCSSLKSITTSKSLTSIGEAAFVGCKDLKNITIPDSVTVLEPYAFSGCSSLTDITIPDSVTSIEDSAFYGCSSLTNVIIPKGVTTIGKDAFSNCTGLTSVILPKSAYNDSAFSGLPSSIIHITYNINCINDGNGTVTANKTNTYGTDSIELTITPNNGYRLEKITWTVGNKVVELSPDVNGKYVMPDSETGDAAEIKGWFISPYSITVSKTDNGSASVSKESAYAGEEIAITINPDVGYELDQIRVNDISLDGLTFIMTKENTVVTVTFKKIQYSVTISESNYGSATVSKEKAGIGDEVTVIANPDNGYYLSEVKVNGKPINGTTFIMPAENVTVELEFSEQLANTLIANGGKTAKVKYKKLRKKAQSVVRSKVMTVSGAQGEVTYGLVSVKRGKSTKYKKYFKVNATTGNVTVKKKLKKGTYTITCKVTATGDVEHKSISKTVTFKIKVK